jgi:hypothetical protein
MSNKKKQKKYDTKLKKLLKKKNKIELSEDKIHEINDNLKTAETNFFYTNYFYIFIKNLFNNDNFYEKSEKSLIQILNNMYCFIEYENKIRSELKLTIHNENFYIENSELNVLEKVEMDKSQLIKHNIDENTIILLEKWFNN